MRLKLDLQDSRLISDGPPGLLGNPIGLMLADRRPFWGHPTPVTSRQGFTHCDYGWLPITLEDEGIFPPP